MMYPQVNDKNYIINANEFIKGNPSGTSDNYIDFLRSKNLGKFKQTSDTHKDATKGFIYVKRKMHENEPEEKWTLHSQLVYSNVAEKEICTANLKRNSSDDMENHTESRDLKKRKKSVIDKDNVICISDYSNGFKPRCNLDLPTEFYPFPEKLTQEVENCLRQEDVTSYSRILISGNKSCGKTTFIKYMATKWNFRYISLILTKLRDFHSETFWDYVNEYLKDCEDDIIIHCKFNICPAKVMDNFQLEMSPKLSRRVFVIYECQEVGNLRNWNDVHVTFPPNVESSRERMFRHFHKSVNMDTDLTFQMMAKWTPGFEIGDIRFLSHTLHESAQTCGSLTKDNAESIIKNSKKRRNNAFERPEISWSDIGGHEEAIKELKSVMIELTQENNDSKPDGILLHGPPGCGKTFLAKALSSALEFNFISVCCSEILAKYQGESEKNVVEIFSKAKSSEPCILFFDEMDALCGQRADNDSNGSKNNIVNVFLTQMGGLDSDKNNKIFVLGATNRLDQIDPAIQRSGRMGRHILVTLPKSSQERFSVLMASSKNGTRPKFLCNDEYTAENIFEKISSDEYTEGWSHADLAQLICQANNYRRSGQEQCVTMSHILSAHSSMFEQKENERKRKKKERVISTLSMEDFTTRLEMQSNDNVAEDDYMCRMYAMHRLGIFDAANAEKILMPSNFPLWAWRHFLK